MQNTLQAVQGARNVRSRSHRRKSSTAGEAGVSRRQPLGRWVHVARLRGGRRPLWAATRLPAARVEEALDEVAAQEARAAGDQAALRGSRRGAASGDHQARAAAGLLQTRTARAGVHRPVAYRQLLTCSAACSAAGAPAAPPHWAGVDPPAGRQRTRAAPCGQCEHGRCICTHSSVTARVPVSISQWWHSDCARTFRMMASRLRGLPAMKYVIRIGMER